MDDFIDNIIIQSKLHNIFKNNIHVNFILMTVVSHISCIGFYKILKLKIQLNGK